MVLGNTSLITEWFAVLTGRFHTEVERRTLQTRTAAGSSDSTCTRPPTERRIASDDGKVYRGERHGRRLRAGEAGVCHTNDELSGRLT